MKISTKLLSLLLAFAMILTLAPSARMEENDQTGVLTALKLSSDSWSSLDPNQTTFDLELEPNASESLGGVQIKASLEPSNDPVVQELHVSWVSSDPNITGVSEMENGHSGAVYGKAPGKATVTVTAGSGANQKQCTIYTVVSGIQLSEQLSAGITVAENQSVEVKLDTDFFLFGNAASQNAQLTASIVNNKTNVRTIVSGGTITIEGREAGDATVVLQISSAGYDYKAEFPVTVTSSEQVITWTEGCSVSKPLKFSVLEELIASKYQEVTGQTLSSIVGLNVPTAQGTLYLGYASPESPGAGVGGSVTYYYHTAARGPYIRDITFVPNAGYAGEKAYITFTGQGTDSSGGTRTFKGKIEVTLTQEKTDLTASTRRDTPLKLSSSLFAKSCQEQTGSPLSYVVFTLPPAAQGVLYTDYKSEWDYGSRVSANERYKQSALEKITFVPAQGFVGTVTINFAGYSVSGSKYNGQLIVQVKQGLDAAITYNDNGAGFVSFAQGDFDDFCENATGRLTGSVSFTPPSANQGKLYSSWNGDRGAEVVAGNSYSAAMLDRITFVAANGFDGVVRIPFTGVDRAGEEFSGTVEVHIQSSYSGGGDISYVCAPEESVNLVLSDFTALCQSMTGQKLHYISFQSLPDFNMGTLYHGRTSSGGIGKRVTTATKYFNSATPYISNLSFWAKEGFRGGVEIPFTGCAVSGETFTGLMYISSGDGAGSGGAVSVRYSSGPAGVTFSGKDFDEACRQATNAALSYVRFQLPSSGQGILYYDYRSSSNPTALNTATNLYRSGEVSVDKVTFVPAKGFAGLVQVPFTGSAIDGRTFQGTVEITAQSAAALGGLVRYETNGVPVHISAYDIQNAAGGVPASLRLTALPSDDQGKLYYQYVSPTQYSWQGNTTTQYSLSGDPSVSNLTFIPRAGYYGTVEIPYIGTNQDNSTYTGAIRITVTEPDASASFDDLSGYSAQTKSAVDFLSSLGVVNGTGDRTYEPGASIRRGDFCLMLSRAFRFDVGGSSGRFSDVPVDAYYAQAVNEMYALGIVNGVGGGRFQPSSTLSRQDAALMVQRALQQAGISAPNGSDAALAAYGDRSQVASYARGAVGGLLQQGMLPTRDGRISPRSNLSRAEMALLLHRAMTR